jgi:hypothetical protein
VWIGTVVDGDGDLGLVLRGEGVEKFAEIHRPMTCSGRF